MAANDPLFLAGGIRASWRLLLPFWMTPIAWKLFSYLLSGFLTLAGTWKLPEVGQDPAVFPPLVAMVRQSRVPMRPPLDLWVKNWKEAGQKKSHGTQPVPVHQTNQTSYFCTFSAAGSDTNPLKAFSLERLLWKLLKSPLSLMAVPAAGWDLRWIPFWGVSSYFKTRDPVST